jgi:hypothetical protein
MASNGFIAFMQGVTGAGLFTRLRRPGAPKEFIDSRTVEQYVESGNSKRSWLSTASRYFPKMVVIPNPKILALHSQINTDQPMCIGKAAVGSKSSDRPKARTSPNNL